MRRQNVPLVRRVRGSLPLGARQLVGIGGSGGFDVTHCTPDLEAWVIERMYGGVDLDYGRQEAEDSEESRNPRLEAQGRDAQSEEGLQGQRSGVTACSPTSEALARTKRAPVGHDDPCSARHTRSGSSGPQLRPRACLRPRRPCVYTVGGRRSGRNRLDDLNVSLMSNVYHPGEPCTYYS